MNLSSSLSIGFAVVLLAGAAIVSPRVIRADDGGAQPQQRTAYGGRALFTTYCATCHGTMGKGDGAFAASLKKRPSDLTQLTKQNGGTFPEERVTRVVDGRDLDPPVHGARDMPVWGDAFSRTTVENDPESVRMKIDALVKFVQTLQERPAIQ